jgi:hypothetical protein
MEQRQAVEPFQGLLHVNLARWQRFPVPELQATDINVIFSMCRKVLQTR